MIVKEHLRAQETALADRLPCIYLVDSGGAFLPLQERFSPTASTLARILNNQARMSAVGIPQVINVSFIEGSPILFI